jgi:hypothetical protein
MPKGTKLNHYQSTYIKEHSANKTTRQLAEDLQLKPYQVWWHCRVNAIDTKPDGRVHNRKPRLEVKEGCFDVNLYSNWIMPDMTLVIDNE